MFFRVFFQSGFSRLGFLTHPSSPTRKRKWAFHIDHLFLLPFRLPPKSLSPPPPPPILDASCYTATSAEKLVIYLDKLKENE